MSVALTIKNLNEKKSEASPLPHDFLPKPCFRLVVVGCSHSGKSNMLKNLLTLPEYGYRDYYGENIFIFSKTLDLDETWKSMRHVPKTHLYTKWDEDVVRQIMEYSKKQKRGCLFVLDDLISDGDAFNRKNSNLLSELFYTGRHWGVSLAILSQRYHAIQPALLANASAVIVFRLKTKREQEAFTDSMTQFDNLGERYDYATKERFSFLYMNLTTGRCYRNFVEEI